MRPVVLVILDGWGYSAETRGNAIAAAQKPNLDSIEDYFPHTLLQSSGVTVGLPWGEPGNSEVGHTSMGTGQIWHQPLTRITKAIQDGMFFKNPVLKKAAEHAKANQSTWHLVGLLGTGSVHSYIDHLYGLIEFAKNENIGQVWLHLFTDGQDSPPKEAATLLQNLQAKLDWIGVGKIASCIGRFYGMDRDNHWDRIEKAYRLITEGAGEPTSDFTAALKKQYGQNINDNHIEPLILVDQKNEPQGLVKNNDAVIFFNIREDRARQLTRALARPDFKEFARRQTKNIFYASLIPYEASLSPYVEVIFPPPELKYTLSRIISANDKKQFKVAETEKYAHVTYFFNGGQEEPIQSEERKLIPSQPTVHFEETPQMRAQEIGEALIEAIKGGQYDFLLANLANADMLGHTGNFEAVKKGVEVIDGVIGQIATAVLEVNGAFVITADHGNAEQMINLSSGEPYTEHTLNPVPFYLLTNAVKKTSPGIAPLEIKGLLPDVAATVLDLMGIPVPADMDGQSLLPILYQQ